MDLYEEAFLKLLGTLEDLNYCFFSGFAVKLYEDMERECDDLDILVQREGLYKFAERLGTGVEKRFEEKEGKKIDDLGFTTKFKGLKVEASSGFPRRRFKEGLCEKIFANTTTKKFLGKSVSLVPLEELIVHKAKMFRDKDKIDLEKLRKKDYDIDFLKELSEDWGEKGEILDKLRKIGFELK